MPQKEFRIFKKKPVHHHYFFLQIFFTGIGKDFENKIDVSHVSNQNIKSAPAVSANTTNIPSSLGPFKGRRKTKLVHKCVHCPKTFPSGHYLKFHVNSVHAKNKKIGCDLCTKSFSEHYYLRQHIKRIHSLIRPFVCDICSTSFSIKYDLVVHSRHVLALKSHF